jgi:N-acetylmuramoyl-L-alanine amidase
VSFPVRTLVVVLAAAFVFAGSNAPVTASGDGAAARAAPVTAMQSRIAGDDKRTRFVVDVDSEVVFGVFTLADPYRVILDLPETVFRLAPEEGREGRGLVAAYRYGLIGPGKSRIVLDTSGPVKVDKAFVVAAVDDQPARIVVDLVATSREEFLAALALEPARPSVGRAAPSNGIHEAVRPGAGPQAREIVVVIDPGHGGIDSGARSKNGTLEKDVVLAFSKQLRSALSAGGRFRVEMTRTGDAFVPLADRVAFARSREASLFISVHADSVAAGGVSGATVYTLSERASDAVAAALAEQENRSDVIAGVDLSGETDAVADILIDLVQRETKNYAVFFARTLVDKLKSNTGVVKNPHRSAGFKVLRAHDVPSVLLELGYLTNSDDEKHLTDSEWQQRIARSVAEAVSSYFGENHARAPF